MPRKRKTYPVDTLRDDVNASLERSHDRAVQYRLGVASMLEHVLMETNNYRGFSFTDGSDGDRDPSRRRYY